MIAFRSFKKIPVFVGAIVLIAGTLAAALPDQPKYKNLKILPKNITELELNKIMDQYEKALGVECSYCHKKDKTTDVMDYASDDKGEKDMARKMMLMTADINQRHFNYNNDVVAPQTITCYTCHKGTPIPEWQEPAPKPAESLKPEEGKKKEEVKTKTKSKKD